MSQENVQPSGQSDTESSGSQDKVAYTTYQKVLGEKKKMAEKLGELESKLQSIEETKLQEQGKFKEAAEVKSKEAQEWKQKATNLAHTFASLQKEQALKLKAQELGMQPKALEKLTALVDLNEIELDDSLQVNQGKVSEILSNLQKEHDYLFKKSVAATKDVFPGTPSGPKSAEDLKKLSTSELMSMYKEVSLQGYKK